MSRLFSAPAIAAAPRVLTRPDPVWDPALVELLERAAAEAYARGRADGAAEARAQARADAVAEAGRAAGGIADTLSRGLDALRAEAVDRCRETVELAVAMAEAVLGREPHDGAAALLARLERTLDALDDDPLVVSVSAADQEVVAAALEGIEVRTDVSLAPGEARVAGRWAAADLTRSTLLTTLREALA